MFCDWKECFNVLDCLIMDAGTKQLTTMVDDSDACFLQFGEIYRLYYKTANTVIDIGVEPSEIGLQVMLHDLGEFAAAKVLTWTEAAALTRWVRQSFYGMGELQ